MKKYYLMAINLGNHTALNNFIAYYDTEKNYSELLDLLLSYEHSTTRETIIKYIIKLDISNKTPKEEKYYLDF
jgi:hypothetical protein